MRINVIIAVNAQIKPQMLLLKCILTLAQGEHMLGMRAHNAAPQAQLVRRSLK